VLVFEGGAPTLRTLLERTERRNVTVAIYTSEISAAGN
jgi:hypothetical protein